jgi:hypothetical protein
MTLLKNISLLVFSTFFLLITLNSYGQQKSNTNSIIYPQEKHFKKLTQLTFGGNNAEAYFNKKATAFSFQSDYSKWGAKCDQIFYWEIGKKYDSIHPPMSISKGLGRTTCSYIMPNNKEILFASTKGAGNECPPTPPRGAKYVWPIYSSFDIYVSDLKGNIKRQLTNQEGYDAEATISPKGDKIVFTSTRSGDLELYIMDIDGKNVKQITSELGYDGGAFFSPDGKKLVFRASRPKTPEEVKEYKELLSQGLVQPTNLEIFTVNVDGSDLKQVTHLGKANWAPFFHPNGKKIIFASNSKGTRGFNFNLFMVDLDGQNLEQITYDDVFDAFPMFSADGKYLIFSSNRNNNHTHDTNLFLAEWKD